MTDPVHADELRIVPANHATWRDLEAIFGTADYPFHCQCQRFKVTGWLWRDTSLEERLAMQRASTACGKREAAHTSGLVAYLDAEPVGWVAVEPRIAYPKLRTSRVPWTGRSEDKDDDGISAVTCFCVRKGFRGRGITYPLARAAADYVGVGPVYATPTKDGRPAVGLEYVRHAAAHARVPWFAIGGIDETNVAGVVAAGAQRVAVVRAVGDAEDPERAASALRAALGP